MKRKVTLKNYKASRFDLVKFIDRCKKQGLNNSDVAELFEVSPQILSSIKNDKRPMSKDMKFKLRVILSVVDSIGLVDGIIAIRSFNKGE